MVTLMIFDDDDYLIKEYVKPIANYETEENPQGVLDRIRRDLSDYTGHSINSNQELSHAITLLINELESKKDLLEKDDITSLIPIQSEIIKVFKKEDIIHVVSSMLHMTRCLREIDRFQDETLKQQVTSMIYDVSCKLAFNAIKTIQQITCRKNVALEGLLDDTIVANGKTLYELTRMKLEYEHMKIFR